jgi:hypothetical protein
MTGRKVRMVLVATAHEIRRLHARLDEVWDDEQARMDTWAAIQSATARFEALGRDLMGRSTGMDELHVAGERSSVEARTLASGQVTYVVRVVVGTATIEEMRQAVDLAQQTLLYATTEDDGDDDSGNKDDEPDDEPPPRKGMVRIAE